jgi:hypothetical protein
LSDPIGYPQDELPTRVPAQGSPGLHLIQLVRSP